MASKKNSKNYAFRYSFAFGLIIFGVVFSLSGGILYHLFVRAQEADLVPSLRKSRSETQELHEDSAVIDQDEPQIRVDTVFITKYVKEECKKKHCESTETSVSPPKDTASQ
jgi:hypothetical protein